MKKKTIGLIILGVIFSFIYVLLSYMIKDTESIWVQTRIFGILSYVFLFLSIVLGELRLLSKNKAKFKLFRFHIPIAIFSVYLVFLHFIAAAFDNYKWGKSLSFINYLGFSFSDKWLIFLSFGTLAFYLILLVAFLSSKKSIRMLGFKKWKLTHYFSYLSFIMVQIHSVNLGTDVKSSSIAFFIKPLFGFMFLIVISFLIARIIVSLIKFSDQKEINLVSLAIIILIFGGVLLIGKYYDNKESFTDMNQKILLLDEENKILEQQISVLETNISDKTEKISSLKEDVVLLDKTLRDING